MQHLFAQRLFSDANLMLLVVVGAGASFDSIPSRPPRSSSLELSRPPLADELFESRPLFEKIQRLQPQVMQIAPSLMKRPTGKSVEDVLADYVSQIPGYPHRKVQLAATRFYIQAIIAECENAWYRHEQIATNMMSLVDQIERFRRDREPPVFVTFNYDRLIENALENRGQTFQNLNSYVTGSATPVVKLHGSVDWIRRLGELNRQEFSGSVWAVAREIAEAIGRLPEPGPIEWSGGVTSPSITDGYLSLPAIAIPVREKDKFECPDAHIEFLRSVLPRVHTILTIGWRGGEEPFLQMLRKGLSRHVEVICVTGSGKDSRETIATLQRNIGAFFEEFSDGFTSFVTERRVERLCRISWED